jgi:hypothetical protein
MLDRAAETGERAICALSGPVMISGLGMVALAGSWSECGAGAALVMGASLVLATSGWQTRALALVLALLGAPIVAALLAGQ